MLNENFCWTDPFTILFLLWLFFYVKTLAPLKRDVTYLKQIPKYYIYVKWNILDHRLTQEKV